MKAVLFAVGLPSLALCLESDFVSLLQSHANVMANEEGGGGGGCSVLINHNTYFTTEIQAGTDSQKLDVVVDTGSDELVVPSCTCSNCRSKDKCLKQAIPSGAESVKISYGSGDIQAAVLSAPVKVGSVQAEMHESILAMTRNELDISGSFEGILALGPPHRGGNKKWVRLPSDDDELSEGNVDKKDDYFYTKSFLEEASINRFSLCFNKGSNGALHLGDAVHSSGEQLGNIGDLHWGLGLTGVSAGSASADALVCKPGSSGGGSSTACGAIPDSGTTLLLGPPAQINALYAGLCREWDPCKAAAAKEDAASSVFGDAALASTFVSLVKDCKDISSLPPIFFHLSGSGGASQTVSISASNYIFRDSGMCIPAFDNIEYYTAKNGPVWILGLPLFLEYTVSYDVGVSPPTMSFTSGSCTSCGGSLFRSTTETGPELLWNISRKIEPPRKPRLDLSQPL